MTKRPNITHLETELLSRFTRPGERRTMVGLVDSWRQQWGANPIDYAARLQRAIDSLAELHG